MKTYFNHRHFTLLFVLLICSQLSFAQDKKPLTSLKNGYTEITVYLYYNLYYVK